MAPLAASLADTVWGDGRLSWTRRLPLLPDRLARHRPGGRPFPAPAPDPDLPDELRTVAGIWRDPAVEQQAFDQVPLRDFVLAHPEAKDQVVRHSWNVLVPSAPRLQRSVVEVQQVTARRPVTPPAERDATTITQDIRACAEELGLSAVGFARYDPKYTFTEYATGGDESVIVCVLEQPWAATQTAPSGRSERSAFQTYSRLNALVARLAGHIQDLGYRARPQNFAGESIQIHYGVQAGLGQLGLNGQLLTPAAGSRARLALIETNAPVVPGSPVDYGIHAICDRCQACVRRCPVGAIPKRRRPHRGVIKAAIKPERCFPVVVHNHGCAICMKVCPVQRYGLDAVVEQFRRDGTIKGRDTDELEGFNWPQDGRFYPAGRKPPITAETVNPQGWYFDRNRIPKFEPNTPAPGAEPASDES
jgi:ferredoxin